MNMDAMKEKVATWSNEDVAGHLEGVASTLKTSNQPVYPSKQLVYALERAAELLRGK